MPESVLFHLKNLKCAYSDQDRVVLNIRELIIPRGKIVFIVGSSGSGKSTLLETLGLMNSTVRTGDINFYPSEENPDKIIELSHIWKDGDQKLNEIRKDNFSFIFQQTNLMENFTAYENVCLSEMIKDEVKLEETLTRAKALMERVRLSETEVGIDKMPVFLSGGQRQRLSFVRALCNDANVIFCDEPTGNLDEANANELFEVIREETAKGRSAIIVSHDINLAVKHADQILVLTKNSENNYGELLLTNIFEKQHWSGFTEIEILQFKNKIKGLFSSREQGTKTESKAAEYNYFGFDFPRLFRKRESNSLRGKSSRNFLIVSVILLFTFLAIGFANGSLNYMSEKMNSAFVNLVTFPVPANKAGEKAPEELVKKIDKGIYKNQYFYESVSPFVSTGVRCFAFKTNSFTKLPDTIQAKGAKSRSVDLNIDRGFIEQEILSDKNFIRGNKKGFKNNNDFSVIVSNKFLSDFGYPEDADFIYWTYLTTDTTGREAITVSQSLPVPIAAVVEELPGKYYFFFPLGAWAAWMNDEESKHFSYFSEYRTVKFFLKSSDQNEIKELAAAFSKDFKAQTDNNILSISSRADTMGASSGATFEFTRPDEAVNHRTLDTLWQKITKTPAFVKIAKKIVRIPVFQDPDYNFSGDFQHISIYFTKLDKIDEFDAFIRNQNEQDEEQTDKFQIDISKVKEKKNYLFLSKVAIITSFFLVFFSTAAISLFMYFLLSAHLNKVKMNIGTFLAIGLSANKARAIYFSIILRFILVALMISSIIAFGVGELINFLLKLNVKSEDGMNYFIFFDWITLATFLIVLTTSLVVSRFTIRRILFKSPGDLVYNR